MPLPLAFSAKCDTISPDFRSNLKMPFNLEYYWFLNPA